jgi:D-3-phosphoglycerate dehydrogenase
MNFTARHENTLETDKLRILISTSTFGQTSSVPLSLLETFGVEYTLNPFGRRLNIEETIELLRGCDGLIAGTEQLDRRVLGQAARLKVISRCGTGLDNVDLAAAAEKGIRVYNTPSAPADAVSELTLGGILDLLRQISFTDRAIRRGTWDKPMGRLLRGKTVGIIGLGRVGKALVKLLQPFGVQIISYDPRRDEAFADTFHVTYVPLDVLLTRVDVITLHLSYSEQVYHLLDQTRLAKIKPTAILVNCARGGIVDEIALYERLRSGHLAGAYLDTFEQEPYVGPLAELPNVLMTSHIGSYAQESRADMEVEAVRNLLGFFQTNVHH